MTLKERSDRDREAIRSVMLTAARDLFVTEGYRNVSMRKIADGSGYSPGAIYGYFESKDDIFFALAAEGFRMLQERARQLADSTEDPLESMRLGFWAYYLFSREQPQYFELMFLDRNVPQITGDLEQFAFLAEMTRGAVVSIERCMAEGILPATTDAGAAFHVLWAAVHGAASIALCDRMAPHEDRDALAHDVLEAAIAGLRAGITTSFIADPDYFAPCSAREAGNRPAPDHFRSNPGDVDHDS
jgi:AcrR family transcriptional regulator